MSCPIDSSHNRKRVRVRTLFEKRNPRKNGVIIKTQTFPYPYAYNFMMCRYLLGYKIDGVPLFALREWIQSDRIINYRGRRKKYTSKDMLVRSDVSGFTFPLEYKGPLFEFVLRVRQILFANELLWFIRDVDELVIVRIATMLKINIPLILMQDKF